MGDREMARDIIDTDPAALNPTAEWLEALIARVRAETREECARKCDERVAHHDEEDSKPSEAYQALRHY